MIQMQNIVIKPVKPVSFIQCKTIITKNSVDISAMMPKIINNLLDMDDDDFCTMIDRLARFWKHGGKLQGKTSSNKTVIIEHGTNNIHIMVEYTERWVEIKPDDPDAEENYKMVKLVSSIDIRCDNGEETYLYSVYHYLNDRNRVNLRKMEQVAFNFDVDKIVPYTDAEIPNELAEFIDDYL